MKKNIYHQIKLAAFYDELEKMAMSPAATQFIKEAPKMFKSVLSLNPKYPVGTIIGRGTSGVMPIIRRGRLDAKGMIPIFRNRPAVSSQYGVLGHGFGGRMAS